MFKFILKVCIIASLIGISCQASEIGVIDTAAIFQKAKFVQNFRDSFAEKEKEFNELNQKKQEKIQEALSKGDNEKATKLAQERDEELTPKKEQLMQLEMSFQQTFLLNVQSTSKKVAEEYGIDIILDSNVVYYGGFDITDFVLTKLNQ